MKLYMLALAASALATIGAAPPATDRDQPWNKPGAILILDPYAPNGYNIDLVASDPKVKAIIHQASKGMATDAKFLTRAQEAKRHHIRWGAYHLGLTGDPVEQADLFLSLVQRSCATFMALDIEAIGGNNMPLDKAIIFINRVHDKTGRYPVLYTNWSTARIIGQTYRADSVFAKTPLWIARFRKALPPLDSNPLWQDYTIWQFASELNCPEEVRAKHQDALCEPYRPYRVPSVRYDMDVNVLNGGEARLTELFGPAP